MYNCRVSLLEARLIQILRERLADSKLSQREVERRLRMGHGTLGNLLNGRTPLKVRQLEVLSELLGLTTGDVLLDALGVPYGLRTPPEEGRDRAIRNLEALILEVERHTSADLGRIRAEVLTLENASFKELVGFSRLFHGLMARYTEIVLLFNGWLERRQATEGGDPVPPSSRPN